MARFPALAGNGKCKGAFIKGCRLCYLFLPVLILELCICSEPDLRMAKACVFVSCGVSAGWTFRGRYRFH